MECFVGPDEEPGRYILERGTGAGAEASVFRGRHIPTGEVVAIKLLSGRDPSTQADDAVRWQKQVALRRRAVWPGVVNLRECFVGGLPHPASGEAGDERAVYLVMDWVNGPNLDAVVRKAARSAVAINQILEDLMPVAVALDRMHQGGHGDVGPVVHGDVKPTNVIMTNEHGGVLVDLGLSCAVEKGRDGPDGGTPGYLAPEVFREGLSPAADRYSFAATVYFVLTGEQPPVRADDQGLRDRLSRARVVQGQPEICDRVIRGLSLAPGGRPSHLAAWLPTIALRTPTKRWRRPVMLAGLAAGIAAAASVLVCNPPGGEEVRIAPCTSARITAPEPEKRVDEGLVMVEWEPHACRPMVLQWYQRDNPTPGAEVQDAVSGESHFLPGPRKEGERTVRTELKIWVPGASTPSHSVYILVGAPPAAQGAPTP